MRAVTIPRFGDADVLALADVPVPEPGPGQIAIDVAYAGLNYAEVLYRRGIADVPLPFVPGIEVSGHVRALGEGVRGPGVGQAVAALTIVDSGGYAEVVVTDARLVAPLDGRAQRLPLSVAAGVPANSTTGLLVVEHVARLRSGETVLVHAAAGGAGSQVGQAARMLGARRVVGTVGSQAKIEAARAFGYDEVVLRDSLDAALRGDGAVGEGEAPSARVFNVVVDPVGGPGRSLDAVALDGRLVVMGNASGADDVAFSANELWLSHKAVLGFNLAAFSAARPAEVGAALRRALQAVGEGTMRVEIQDKLPLEQAAEGHRRIESGQTVGKTVLAVGRD
jgi:NADPH2:quinone reductase